MRRAFAMTLFTLVIVVAARPPVALACSCSGPPPGGPPEAAGFDGVVVAGREVPRFNMYGDAVIWTVDVQRPIRKIGAGRVEVASPKHEGSCGYEFRIGGTYRVFAEKRDRDILETGLCMGNEVLTAAPPGAPPPAPYDPGFGGPLVAGLLSALALGGVAAAVVVARARLGRRAGGG